MAQKKLFQDLNLNNAFLFAAALEEPETCKLVLELILGEPVGEVEVKTERMVLFSPDFRCIRMDVYASDGLQAGYNLEMQNQNEKNLPKRSRYHQAEMDLSSLKPGQTFDDLKPSLIVFICTFDPFGRKLYRYTFEQRCLEADFPLGDETKRIFLNTKGENEKDVPAALVHFLHYVSDSTDAYVQRIGDPAIHELHDKVKLLKKSRRLEERYMTMQEWMEQQVKQQVKLEVEETVKEIVNETAKEATERTLQLVSRMLENGEADRIPKLREEAFYQEMLRNYHL